MSEFALIGAAGYVAPRHFIAIKENCGTIVSICDKCDSVGGIDAYFPNSVFFNDYELFLDDLFKRKFSGRAVDYLTICTPNYLHASQVRLGLLAGCNVICEKPLVLTCNDLYEISRIEKQTGRRVNAILQMRLHNAVEELKRYVAQSMKSKYEVVLTYITPRGNWYHNSWKSNIEKSGGLAYNIGLHFFDMLIWVFGNTLSNRVDVRTPKVISGLLNLERANVRYFLSIDDTLFNENDEFNGRHRVLLIDGMEFDFTSGFENLHTKCYSKILSGNGFTIEDATPAIQTLQILNWIKPCGVCDDSHPLLKSYKR